MIDKNLIVFFLNIFSYKTTRWVISFICIVCLASYSTYEINVLSHTTGYNFNVYDVLFYQFGLFMSVFLIIGPVYLYLICDAFIDNRIDTYVYIRFTQKNKIWINKVISIFIITIIFLTISFFTTLTIGFLSLGIPEGWSEGAINLKSIFFQEEFNFINSDLFSLDPRIGVFFLLSLLFLGLFSLGLFINIFNIFFKKVFISFGIGLICNFLLLVMLKFNDLITLKILPYQHFLLTFRELTISFFNPNSLIFSYCYWINLILFLLLISYMIFKKSNYIFEVKQYD